MISIEELIALYGYVAIAVGTFLEGETVLVLGGFAASRGYLELPWVIFWAFTGTVFGDQLYFYIGRVKGIQFLSRRSHWKEKSDKVFVHLHKHQVLLILGFRFLYGLRTVTPFLIGASGIEPRKFAVLNIIGAFIWAVSIGVLGYLFGHALELIMGDIKRYEIWLLLAMAIIGALLWCFVYFRKPAPSDKSK